MQATPTTFTNEHEILLAAAAKRLAPELAAWTGEHVEDIELEMRIESVAALGFRLDSKAADAAQVFFWEAIRRELDGLQLTPQVRAFLDRCDAPQEGL